MKHKDLNGIVFSSLKADKNTIYAEYTVPAEDDTSYSIEKVSHIDSLDFQSFLNYIVVPDSDKQTVKEAISDVKAYCRLYGNKDTISPKVRTAGKLKDGLIEYALYNDEYDFIEVKPDGCNIIGRSYYKFIDNATSNAQVTPTSSSKTLLKLMKKYVNADSDSRILYVTWLVQAFCEGNHSALLIMAERGCGKTTLTKITNRIIDPSKTTAAVLSNRVDNLFTTLTNSYVVAFDNTGAITKEVSDILCTAITGGTYTKRELFTTNSLATYILHNTVIINGIDVIPTESDLAQRCLFLKLKKLSDDNRTTASDIMSSFEHDLPSILGSIFDTLHKAMEVIKTLKPRYLPRMADSYFEMLAIAMALGVVESEFERIYRANEDKLNKARGNSDFVIAIKEYMENHVKGKSLEGTATQVYSKIRNASVNKNALTNSVSKFSGRLSREYATLFAAGYRVNIDDTFSDSTRIKIIKRSQK